MANHSTWQTVLTGLHQTSKLPLQQSPRQHNSVKAGLSEAGSSGLWRLVGEKDHLRGGTFARLGSGSANLSCSSFKSTFLNMLPWGQRNSQNKHEFFRRMECVYCYSLRHKGDKKGLFSDFREDILSINFQQHIQTTTHKNTTYMNMYMWLPPPQFWQKPILVNHLHVPLL